MQHGLTDNVEPDLSTTTPDTGSPHVETVQDPGGRDPLEPTGVGEEPPDTGGLSSRDAPDGLVQQDDQSSVITPIPGGEAG